MYKSWRENGEKKFAVEAFKPYFYINESESEITSYSPSKYIKRDFFFR